MTDFSLSITTFTLYSFDEINQSSVSLKLSFTDLVSNSNNYYVTWLNDFIALPFTSLSTQLSVTLPNLSPATKYGISSRALNGPSISVQDYNYSFTTLPERMTRLYQVGSDLTEIYASFTEYNSPNIYFYYWQLLSNSTTFSGDFTYQPIVTFSNLPSLTSFSAYLYACVANTDLEGSTYINCGQKSESAQFYTAAAPTPNITSSGTSPFVTIGIIIGAIFASLTYLLFLKYHHNIIL
jgi:hypothetical protein